MHRSGWVVIVMLLLAACGGDGDLAQRGRNPQFDPTSTTASGPTSSKPTTPTPDATATGTATGTAPAPASTASSSRSATQGTVITTGDSEFGEMLFDTRNQAIYLFEPEADGTPACYDECAVAWPPVLTDGEPQADGNTDADLLGTVERDDGTTQVTYNGWPLYFYAHEGPGEVLCHDIVLNGGLWLVLGPDGNARPA